MKPLQPILDMLERADNPRARVIEAMKPKLAKATDVSALSSFGLTQMEMLRRQVMINEEMVRQQARQQYNPFGQAMGRSPLFGPGGF